MKALHQIGWYGLNGLLGVEINVQTQEVKVILIHKQKGEVKIVETWEMSSDQLSSFLTQWSFSSIILSIKEAGSIEKMISGNHTDLISEVLGVKIERKKDFLVQKIPAKNEAKWVGIIRSDVFEEVLDLFGHTRERIIYTNLSAVTNAFLIPGIPGYEPKQCYKLAMEESLYQWKGGLVSDGKTNVSLSKDALAYELGIDPEWLDLYSSIIHFYLANGKDIESFSAIKSQQKEAERKHFWTKSLKIEILVILTLLFFGLTLKTYSSYAENQAKKVITENREILTRINQNSAKIKEQETFFSGADVQQLSSSKVSFYIDRIAEISPEDLGFDQIVFHPSIAQLKKIDPSLTDKKPDMIILGVGKTAEGLSLFSLRLEKLDCTSQAELYQSEYDFQTELHRFIFTINLAP